MSALQGEAIVVHFVDQGIISEKNQVYRTT